MTADRREREPQAPKQIAFVTFSLIIDDLIFPDQTTALGLLGGGGPQTAFGMRLWADSVGLVSGVGDDLPESALAWLYQTGIDTQGLLYTPDCPTPRAWQHLAADGHRVQQWRVPGQVIGRQLRRSLAHLPPAYRQACGFHLGVHPEDPDLDFIRALRELGAVVSVEPFRETHRPLSDAELRSLLSAGQIFSPNQIEAESLVGPGTPDQLIRRLVEAGASIVALRQGPTGALVHHAQSGETCHIPAIETNVVDVTGAGNAFCGGFLVGWVQTGNLRTAGLYGAVAASFLVEQVGLPDWSTETFAEARRRLAYLTSLSSTRLL
ncbi:MAG: carbohydrate kinase family protein [Anaerolineae bacterium]|nr:carbohydrate kinase family protein [Anaerolineae bacterium]